MPPCDCGELARLFDAIGDDVGLLLLMELLIDALLERRRKRQQDGSLKSPT